MKKSVLFFIFFIFAINISFSQNFKAGKIAKVNDKKPQICFTYCKKSGEVTVNISDGGDNAGLEYACLGDDSYCLSASDTTVTCMPNEFPIEYHVYDIGGNETSGKYSPNNYGDIIIAAEVTADNQILKNYPLYGFTFCIGAKTDGSFTLNKPFKYQGLVLNVRTNSDTIETIGRNTYVRIGYMLGKTFVKNKPYTTSYTGYGYEVMPYAELFSRGKDCIFGIAGSAHVNWFLFELDNTITLDYMSGCNFTNKTSVSTMLASLAVDAGYEFGSRGGQKYSFFYTGVKFYFPICSDDSSITNGFRSSHYLVHEFWNSILE